MEKYISQIDSIIDDFERRSSIADTIVDFKDIPLESENPKEEPFTEAIPSEELVSETIGLEEESSKESVSETSITEQLDLSPKSTAQSSLASDIFLQEVNTFLTDIYKLLNYSVLAGEYIYNENIKSELENILENKLSLLLNRTNSFNLELQDKISEFISAIKIGCSHYIVFINDVENEYSHERIEYLFTFSRLVRKEINNSLLSNHSDNLFNYFKHNTRISLCDHFFSSDNSQFISLFTVEDLIDEIDLIDLENITKVIKLKIGFLEHKWKARKQQENPSSIHYSIDGKTKVHKEYTTDNPKLNEWSSLINSHYELYISTWKYETEKKVKSIKNKKLEDLNYLELHQLIKYYKDVNKNLNKLSEISTFISNKENDGKTYYDKYVLNIISNYSLNNYFSLFLESNSTISSIKEKYLDAKSKRKGDVNNFFLEYKYLEKLTDILNKKIEEVDNITFLVEFENLISNECKETLEQYSTNVEWSKKNENYIFLLPFNECKVEVDEFKIDKLPFIFIASSFVLPTVNNVIEKHFLDIKQKIRSFIFQIDAIKRIRKDLDSIKDLRNEIEKRDFKSIEIISIFTAIITFVMSSIPAFKFVENVWQALLFMLSLASALGIFVLLILFSTRGFRNNRIGVVYVFILAIISYIGYNTLVNFENKEVKIDKATSKKVDSISAIKIDSIILVKELKSKIKPNPKK